MAKPLLLQDFEFWLSAQASITNTWEDLTGGGISIAAKSIRVVGFREVGGAQLFNWREGGAGTANIAHAGEDYTVTFPRATRLAILDAGAVWGSCLVQCFAEASNPDPERLDLTGDRLWNIIIKRDSGI